LAYNSEDDSRDEDKEIDLPPRAKFEETRPTLNEPMTNLQIGIFSNQVIRVETITSTTIRKKIKEVLFQNTNLFASTLADMADINPDFMCHQLAILPQAKPVAQRSKNAERKNV